MILNQDKKNSDKNEYTARNSQHAIVKYLRFVKTAFTVP